MYVFNGVVDGWGPAMNFLQSVAGSCSCLWFNGATGKVNTLTIWKDALGHVRYRIAIPT